jgi:hypothetical protein
MGSSKHRACPFWIRIRKAESHIAAEQPGAPGLAVFETWGGHSRVEPREEAPTMSFLETLCLGVIKSERDMLHALRNAAEGWYNELTRPFLPMLLGDEEGSVPSEKERIDLSRLANDMLCAEMLINDGDALENKLAEIEKSSGIPLFSGRQELRNKTVEFLNSGVFLKAIAYKLKKAGRPNDYCSVVRDARTGWQDFQSAKDGLVAQINSQLARIG